MNIEKNILALTAAIHLAEREANRPEGAATLIAVSKKHPVDAVKHAYKAGLTHFGENYAQELHQKASALTDLPLVWHFIGPLQSNKVDLVANTCEWVHTVDREKIAERLSTHRLPSLPRMNVLIQVNISGEPNKSGVTADKVPDLAKFISHLPNVTLRGLMCMPAFTTDVELQRKQARELHDILDSLNKNGYALDTLSMGTTHDFASAIHEGATMIRIGTAVFGPRPYSN